MIEFTQADWLRFRLRPWEFYGKKILCSNFLWRGVIAKKTKSNMVGVILVGEKNITAFSYRDLAWEDEQ